MAPLDISNWQPEPAGQEGVVAELSGFGDRQRVDYLLGKAMSLSIGQSYHLWSCVLAALYREVKPFMTDAEKQQYEQLSAPFRQRMNALTVVERHKAPLGAVQNAQSAVFETLNETELLLRTALVRLGYVGQWASQNNQGGVVENG